MTTIRPNANINITNENINNVSFQPPAAPQNRQPRNDLPPELQNARPSGRSILARIGAFLLGAGAAGSASAFLGGGALLTSAIGVGAASFLGATAVAGIATGGAALVGGLIGLGIYAGIRAIVNHFRRAPAPQPRVQINSGLPQAQPAADMYNNITVASAIQRAKEIPVSLKQAAERVISNMREIYGEALVPQGATLNKALGWEADKLAEDIRKLGETVTTQKMEELVEKHMRHVMLYASLNKAIKPLCGQDDFRTEEMRKIVATKNSDLVDALTNATSHEEVQGILKQFAGKVEETKEETVNLIQKADIPDNIKTRWIEKARSGAISGEAKLQSLIENVLKLPEKFQPFMERNILLHSYAPDSAKQSSEAARKLADELSRWENFDTDKDPSMAPLNKWYLDDISNTLYESQTFDANGISSQLKKDADRNIYVINGTVLDYKPADQVAGAITKAVQTEEAAKFISAIVNQRSFGPLNTLSMQFVEDPEVQKCLGKMASRNFAEGGMVHVDLSAQLKNLADTRYTVSVEGNKVHIMASEIVGLDAGVGAGADNKPRLGGLARYTVHFECDLGENQRNPRIESVHLQQEFLPNEKVPGLMNA